MIFIYAIIFRILLFVLDSVVVKLSKEKFSIIGTIENAIDRISGENVWIRLLIVLGTPFLSLYLAYEVFSEDSFEFWVFLILGLVSIGYLGVSWLENNDFSVPAPKAIALFLVGVGLWYLVPLIGTGQAIGDTTEIVYLLPGWIFVIWGIIVYRRARSK